MNKKLFITILVFIFGFAVFVYGKDSSIILGPTIPFCRLEHSAPLTCELSKIVDENNDGNVSFDITIFNNLDYPITNIFLIFESHHGSYTKYEKSIGGKNKLNIKTSDFYNYLDEDGKSVYILENFKLRYVDIYGEKKELQGQIESLPPLKIFDRTQEEGSIKIVFILLLVIILFIIGKFLVKHYSKMKSKK